MGTFLAINSAASQSIFLGNVVDGPSGGTQIPCLSLFGSLAHIFACMAQIFPPFGHNNPLFLFLPIFLLFPTIEGRREKGGIDRKHALAHWGEDDGKMVAKRGEGGNPIQAENVPSGKMEEKGKDILANRGNWNQKLKGNWANFGDKICGREKESFIKKYLKWKKMKNAG
jgi:hypothetical protein